jgi:hypothetical protein
MSPVGGCGWAEGGAELEEEEDGGGRNEGVIQDRGHVRRARDSRYLAEQCETSSGG